MGWLACVVCTVGLQIQVRVEAIIGAGGRAELRRCRRDREGTRAGRTDGLTEEQSEARRIARRASSTRRTIPQKASGERGEAPARRRWGSRLRFWSSASSSPAVAVSGGTNSREWSRRTLHPSQLRCRLACFTEDGARRCGAEGCGGGPAAALASKWNEAGGALKPAAKGWSVKCIGRSTWAERKETREEVRGLDATRRCSGARA